MDIEQFEKAVNAGEISKEESQRARIALTVREFRKAVEENRVADVLLHGGHEGFMLHAKVDMDIEGTVSRRACVLVLKSGMPRMLVNPQTTFRLIHELGIRHFKISIKHWDKDSFYNRHQASVNSRELKQKISMATEGHTVELEPVQGISRSDMLKSRGLYIKIYRSFYDQHGHSLQKTTGDLLKEALDAGFIEKHDRIKSKTFFSWCDADENNESVKVPVWACKAAMNILIREGVYPSNKEPMQLAVFANLWFETRGPFLEKDTKGGDPTPSIRAAAASLPDAVNFPRSEVKPFLKAEIDWYKIVAAKRLAQRTKS